MGKCFGLHDVVPSIIVASILYIAIPLAKLPP